ncbi:MULTISPECIES: toll/interleukin-1 receptor domain-containing protein [unclassified Massilia]|uniref:toll/interleukin-1 receptor domain-containing protein n=1 Tax=unclassified Massilia TaxID=2609279 RepID=UPI0006913982|nr:MULTISPECIES: toll/interleukin-1 receptor domain-containing protein [unclassified Massilia]AWG45913.1 hypothetical protein AM586_28075 [Massilia sp. WG5]
MPYDVFLSHSHVDKSHADAICHCLENAGVRCWVAPRDIRPSEDWAEAIINGMDQCRILLLIFSSSSNNSPQVRREVERAVNKGLTILPFRIEAVAPSKSLEYFISTQHWLDAFDRDLDLSLAELRQSVSAVLGTRRHAEPAPAFIPAPAPPIIPAPSLAPADQEPLALELARVLGPIARQLVKRAALPGRSRQDVIAAVAQEIDDAAERKQFLSRCGAQST